MPFVCAPSQHGASVQRASTHLFDQGLLLRVCVFREGGLQRGDELGGLRERVSGRWLAAAGGTTDLESGGFDIVGHGEDVDGRDERPRRMDAFHILALYHMILVRM